MSEIDPNSLKITCATYYLGKHLIDENVTGEVPVYLEYSARGWIVHAVLGALNSWFLNREPNDQFFTQKDRTKKYGYTTYWRYKAYSLFASKEEAVDHFNAVVYGSLKQAPSQILLK